MADNSIGRIDVNHLLRQMQDMAQQAGMKTGPMQAGAIQPLQENNLSTEKVSFSNLLKQSIDSVNKTQQTAGKLAGSFQRGDSNVSLAEVMVSLEKANVSFQAMTQVRNRLLSAYQEIMNMPV